MTDVDIRPTPKAILPCRAIKDNEGVLIEFFGRYDDGQRAPYYERVGDPSSDLSLLYYPRGRLIYDLMQSYYAVENQVDGLTRERDELKVQVTQLEGQVKSNGAAIRELERRRPK